MDSEIIKRKYLDVGGCASANPFFDGDYGSMIISKYPCIFWEQRMATNMGRRLVVAEPCLPVRLILATAHFESLANPETRKEQLDLALGLLREWQGGRFRNHSIMAGDYNFDSTWVQEEEVLAENGFRDVMHDFVD